jgi:hypothetical protein
MAIPVIWEGEVQLSVCDRLCRRMNYY